MRRMDVLEFESGGGYSINELCCVVCSEIHYILSSVNWDFNESEVKSSQLKIK